MRAVAMIVVMVVGPGGGSLQGPEVLEHGIGPLGRGPHGGQRVVAGLLVRCRAGVLRGHEDADPGALVPLVGQDRHRRPCGPVQGGQHVESGRGRVVGGAGLHRTGVDRESGDNPSPPARCRPAPRPRPEYHRWRPVSGLRRGHPVGADQGPVQAGVRLLRPAQPIQDLGKVWGPVRDHPQGPVAGTCRPWPGSPSSRGPGWSGRFPPPSTSAPAPPEPGRWPPWARASRHAPCGGPPSTGGWCGRWTRGWMTAPRGAFEKDLKNNEPFSPELAAQSRGSAWWCGKEWVWSGCGAHEGRTALHCL